MIVNNDFKEETIVDYQGFRIKNKCLEGYEPYSDKWISLLSHWKLIDINSHRDEDKIYANKIIKETYNILAEKFYKSEKAICSLSLIINEICEHIKKE